MQSGTIKWFNADKGYGFIVADDGSGDVFLHSRDVRSAGIDPKVLTEGMAVNFKSEENNFKKGKSGGKIAKYLELVKA